MSVKIQRQRRVDKAVDDQLKGARIDRWYVVVDQQVVQSRRGDVPAQGLQRHPVVAGGQLQLVARRCLPQDSQLGQAN